MLDTLAPTFARTLRCLSPRGGNRCGQVNHRCRADGDGRRGPRGDRRGRAAARATAGVVAGIGPQWTRNPTAWCAARMSTSGSSSPAGVHRVVVEGLLPDATEWEWTFLLQPRRVAIEAPGWTVTGVRANGVPENAGLLRPPAAGDGGRGGLRSQGLQRDRGRGSSSGSRVDLATAHRSDAGSRRPGKAVSLQVPLLPGERVLTSERGCRERHDRGQAGRRPGPLSLGERIAGGRDRSIWTLSRTDRWVERWHLVTSPVWNVVVDRAWLRSLSRSSRT